MASVEREIENRENERAALELRRNGYSYRGIAHAQGCAVRTAYERVQRAIAAYLPKEEVEDARRVELDRLDELVDVARNIAFNAEEEEVRLKAVDRAIKISERRARLLGLDAPSNAKVEVTGTMSAEDLDRLISQAPDDADARG